MDPIEDITQLLKAAGGGRPGALDEVFASLYPRLRKLARSRRRGLPHQETLNTTALIHEAYMKVRGKESPFEDRGHFFAAAARAMRHVLINHAEERKAEKRGGGARNVTLDAELSEGPGAAEDPTLELLDLDRALVRLEAMSARQARVVECLFFAGLTIDETAEALDLSAATVKRDWAMAKAWLFRDIQAGANRGGSPA